MEERVLNDDVAKKFLLGKLSAEEQGHIEELAFENPETFVFLQAAESDLIDEFLDDDLSADEKESFQQFFLKQPGRRADLRVTRAMHQYLSKKSAAGETEKKVIDPPKRLSFVEWISLHVSPLTVSLATAALIIVVIGPMAVIYLSGQKHRRALEAKYEPTPVPTATPTSTVTASPSSSPAPSETPNKPLSPPRQPPRAAFAIALSPRIATRAEVDEDIIKMPSALELPLVDDTAFRSYAADLQQDDKTIHRWPNLQPRKMKNGPGFEVYVPSGLVKPDQSYRIVLTGISANGTSRRIHYYNFKVKN